MTNLFGHGVRSEILLLFVAEIIVCFVASYVLFSWGLGQAGGVRGDALLFAGLFSVLATAAAGASGLYQPRACFGTRQLLLGTAVAGLLVALGIWATFTLLHRPTLVVLGGNPATIVAVFAAVIVASRLGFAAAARSGLLSHRLAVVGELRDREFLRNEGIDGRMPSFPVARSLADVAALDPEQLAADHVWAVVLANGLVPLDAALQARCRKAGLRIFSEGEFREMRLSRVDVGRLPEGWLGTVREAWPAAAARRALDIAVALGLLLFTLPLLLMVALAIRLESPGPVLYRQDRVGRGGRVFTLYKLRSMVVDAEANGAPRWAAKRDPRVTRVGRFIRLTRIDELPQVLNVLRGDMAIVGPRPERPGFVAELGQAIPHYHDRASVKPGITGWAQVNYPYGASVEDARVKLSYDLYYVRRRSLFLDLLILVATVRVILLQEGAR